MCETKAVAAASYVEQNNKAHTYVASYLPRYPRLMRETYRKQMHTILHLLQTFAKLADLTRTSSTVEAMAKVKESGARLWGEGLIIKLINSVCKPHLFSCRK